jgi:hypothetical protein
VLIKVLSKGFATGVSHSLEHEIQRRLSRADRAHAMMDTARSVFFVSDNDS